MNNILKSFLRPITACGSLFAICFAVPAAASTFMTPQGFQSPQQWHQPNIHSATHVVHPGMPGHPQQQGAWMGNQQMGLRPGIPAVQQQGWGHPTQRAPQPPPQPQQQTAPGRTPEGFTWNAGLSRRYAEYGFSMNNVGSILTWSDVAWNVFDASGRYVRNGIVFYGGIELGAQAGTSIMTDDDVSNGGHVAWWLGDDNNWYRTQSTILSIGESSGGTMLGVHAGIGLVDRFAFGRVRVTPSVGWRHLNYNLTAQNGHGMVVTNTWCDNLGNGEIFCPAVIIGDNGVHSHVPITGDGSWWWDMNTTLVTTDSFYFFQEGTTHSYDVTWSGPFVAVDFDYDINRYNVVNARFELGLPGYRAIGQQPYRIDWAPNAIEDTAPIFGAVHIGLGFNWLTAINDRLSLSIGVMYDLYRVMGADANTNLNAGYWNDIRNIAQTNVNNGANVAANQNIVDAINGLEADCPGWVCRKPGEIDAFFRSVGFRVGLAGAF